MSNVEQLLKGTVEELERLLNAKHVLAEPIEKDGTTIIPMVSYGFGFGAGGGEESKSGTGAGGGIKPVGAIVIDKDGVRIESFKSGMSGFFETMANCCSRMMEKKCSTNTGQQNDEDSGANQTS
jgi:uncharacterized spore protein YtfJ